MTADRRSNLCLIRSYYFPVVRPAHTVAGSPAHRQVPDERNARAQNTRRSRGHRPGPGRNDAGCAHRRRRRHEDHIGRRGTTAQAQQFAVLFADGVSQAQATKAIERAGGQVVAVNTAIGEATVRSSDVGFLGKVAMDKALACAARNSIIGQAPKEQRASRQDVEKLTAERAAAKGTSTGASTGKVTSPGTPGAEPLGYLQWDNAMINATPTGSYSVNRGDSRVKAASSTPASTAPTPTSPRTSTAATPATSSPTSRPSTGRASTRAARTRRTRTTTSTAPTWPAPSALRSTASASPGSPPT